MKNVANNDDPALDPRASAVGGGPRRLDPQRNESILQATLTGLIEHGYDRLSMDEIARKAGVGKAAIYRRWPTKAAVVVDTLIWRREQLFPLQVPDTGSILGDIDRLLEALPDFEPVDQTLVSVFLSVATAASHDPTLAEALNDLALDRPRQVIHDILEHALDRGEIGHDKDLSLIPDIFLGLNMVRMVTHQPIDRAYVQHVCDVVLTPLITSSKSGDDSPRPPR